MKASAFGLCLALGASLSLSPAGAEPRAVYRPTLTAGKVTPRADAVVVGSDGAEWAIPGGARLVAAPGAVMRVIGVPQQLALGPRRTTPTYTVVLRSGDVRVTVPSGGKTAIVVGAPRKTNVLVVSGSTSIGATAERVVVANGEGETSLRVGSEPLRPLRPGMLRQIERGAGAQRPLAESPGSLEFPAVMFAFDRDVASPEIRWPSAPGASGYRVEVRDHKGRAVHRKEVSSTAIEARAFRLPPGKYSARVAGLDPSGLEARSPVERTLRVVGVTVPQRGFVDAHGALHFPAGRHIVLSHAEGIEVTYGPGSHFVPAPNRLELTRAEPRLVRFRASGESAESRLWLVPRQVQARVEFGSALPTWPGNALEIRVRVAETGVSSPFAEIEARPKVLVGLNPVPVEFTRDGDSLLGVLPAQQGKGPWVVRVEVEDESGIPLGRDFIEVGQR